MYGPFKLGAKYLGYWLRAANRRGHGTHSPFVFSLIEDVLNDKQEYPAYDYVESFRKELRDSKNIIPVEDFGAGSAKGNRKEKKVTDIARYAAKPRKFGQLLFRLTARFKPSVIVELGTSLGISTMYLALGNRNAQVITLEGSPAIAGVAKDNFARARLSNIRQVMGNFDETLTAVLNGSGKVDLVFFDGNHRLEPTLRYFDQCMKHRDDQSLFIFDDIHWSEEMEQAWEKIKENPQVTCTVDLFFIGLVFFRKEFKEKQHFVIRF